MDTPITPAQAAALIRANASYEPPPSDSLLALLASQGPAARSEVLAVWELQDELEAASEAGLWPF